MRYYQEENMSINKDISMNEHFRCDQFRNPADTLLIVVIR